VNHEHARAYHDELVLSAWDDKDSLLLLGIITTNQSSPNTERSVLAQAPEGLLAAARLIGAGLAYWNGDRLEATAEGRRLWNRTVEIAHDTSEPEEPALRAVAMRGRYDAGLSG
jgi:hypothetical protein